MELGRKNSAQIFTKNFSNHFDEYEERRKMHLLEIRNKVTNFRQECRMKIKKYWQKVSLINN